MMNEFHTMLKGLDSNANEDAFAEACEGIVDVIGSTVNAIEAIDPILMYMESHPNLEYGTPGPFVHFMEGFFRKGYERRLVCSIKRTPTRHTLWMLNRIINGVQGKEKDGYIQLMKVVANDSKLDGEVSKLAKHFYELHQA